MKALLNMGKILKSGCGHGQLEIKRRTNSHCSMASFAFRIKFKALRMSLKALVDLVLPTLPRSFRVWDTIKLCHQEMPQKPRVVKRQFSPSKQQESWARPGPGSCRQSITSKGLFFFLLKKVFGCTRSYLRHTGFLILVAAGGNLTLLHANTQLWHVDSSSLPMDITQAPCTGSVESEPLDHHGSS